MLKGLKRIWDEARRGLRTYRLVLAHPRTPRLAKVLIALALAYAASPIDLIPDWVPVLGYLDDALIVPGLLLAARWLIPAEVMAECRSAASQATKDPGPRQRNV